MSEFLSQVLGPLAQLLGIAQGASGGALTGLLTQLEEAGLDKHVDSWVGHGENKSLSETDLASALTPEQIQDWSQSAGVSPEELIKVLTEKLPQMVDQATPEGKRPLP